MSEWPRQNSPHDDPPIVEDYTRFTNAAFTLDGEFRFTFLNDQAEHLFKRNEEDLVGKVVWGEFPEAVRSTFRRKFERTIETQEPVTFEEYYPPLDARFELRACPSETGLSASLRDVTDRFHRQRELEHREHALRQANEIIANRDRPFTEQIDALLEVVRKAVGTDYATFSHVHADKYVFEALDIPPDVDLEAGETVPLAEVNTSSRPSGRSFSGMSRRRPRN